MARGYVKTWRHEEEFDLAMPDIQYKVWHLLKLKALHKPKGNLRPGDMEISYSYIMEKLTRSDGATPCNKQIKAALDTLEVMGYIKRAPNRKGKKMLIRINDWAEQQGVHAKGYEYLRPGHELPPEAEGDPFDDGVGADLGEVFFAASDD